MQSPVCAASINSSGTSLNGHACRIVYTAAFSRVVAPANPSSSPRRLTSSSGRVTLIVTACVTGVVRVLTIVVSVLPSYRQLDFLMPSDILPCVQPGALDCGLYCTAAPFTVTDSGGQSAGR